MSPADRIEEARRVLDGNWIAHSTVPAPGLYPHQWNWDTAFIAIGRASFDQARAEEEMLSLFRGQWRTGMLPHIVFNPEVPEDAYFPGPGFWRSGECQQASPGTATSGLTQPPVHALAALEMHRNASDTERSLGFLRRLFPGLVALHRYLRDRRSAGPEGLAYIVHPWESGLDNSPAWGEAFDQVAVPADLPPYDRRDLVNADPRDRPSDEAYDRFVYLALTYRDAGYDDAVAREVTPFLVEDPMFNSIWAWSVHALAEIAEIIDADAAEFRDDHERIVRGIESKLWEEDHHRFFPFDLKDGAQMNHHSIVSFVPLVAPGLDSEKAHLTAHAMEEVRHCTRAPCYLLPTYDVHDADFDPRRYWRGPIWINTD